MSAIPEEFADQRRRVFYLTPHEAYLAATACLLWAEECSAATAEILNRARRQLAAVQPEPGTGDTESVSS